MELKNIYLKNNYEFIYEPEEDSKLLLKNSIFEINKLVKKVNLDILEIGVGSGFVILNLEKKFKKNKFYGSDINPKSIEFVKENKLLINSKINLKLGNLYEPFKNKLFDIILFNTPYFPIDSNLELNELNYKDRAIYGGKKGYETIIEFIKSSRNHLKKNGFSIIIFSSLSNFHMIKEVLEKNLFYYELLETKNFFFEKIYCLKFYFLKILTDLRLKHITNVKFLAKGKHSIVLEGNYKKEKIIIKNGLEKDIQIENLFLEKLKGESFIPKLFFKSKEFSIYKKVEGKTIKDFLSTENSLNIIKVINKIFIITNILDEKKINKLEMTNPYKHIFIDLNLKIKMIDFERCIYSLKPKNTSQFLQYIRRNINLFEEKKIYINKSKLREYSKNIKNKSKIIKFEEILN